MKYVIADRSQDSINEMVVEGMTSMLSTRDLVGTLFPTLGRNKTVCVAELIDRGTADYSELVARGLSEDSARKVSSALQLSRNYLGKTKGSIKISSPDDIYRAVLPHWSPEQEKFIVLGLNGQFQIIYNKVISLGLVNKTLVHPREVFADAIKERCSAIAIAHNHPSGELEPSDEDIKVTERVVQAGKILGIKVLDHIVFTDESHTSLASWGLVPA